jgi:phage-related protein
MTQQRTQRMPAVFFRTESGADPLLDWLRELPREERRALGEDLARLQWRWPVGMPLARPLGGGLHELRCVLPTRRIARLLFFVVAGEIVLLHGFIKKSRKTPQEDLEMAQQRRRSWRRHG